jgi:hypothetical protein
MVWHCADDSCDVQTDIVTKCDRCPKQSFYCFSHIYRDGEHQIRHYCNYHWNILDVVFRQGSQLQA